MGRKRKAGVETSTKNNNAKKKKSKLNSQIESSSAAGFIAKNKGKLDLISLLNDPGWKIALEQEFEKPYFKKLQETLQTEYSAGKTVFPPKELIFNAFTTTPLDKVKVVILGQDPYHDDGQAVGLSFSVPKEIKTPPSLRNIYTELTRDPKINGFVAPDHGCLDAWTKNGILLLNSTLTVEAHKPNSHAKIGWQTFTDSAIKAVSDNCQHVVFILWGNFAQKKERLVDLTKHAVIKTAHPSPLSVSKFKACNCFSHCDDELKKFGLKPMDWSL